MLSGSTKASLTRSIDGDLEERGDFKRLFPMWGLVLLFFDNVRLPHPHTRQPCAPSCLVQEPPLMLGPRIAPQCVAPHTFVTHFFFFFLSHLHSFVGVRCPLSLCVQVGFQEKNKKARYVQWIHLIWRVVTAKQLIEDGVYTWEYPGNGKVKMKRICKVPEHAKTSPDRSHAL